VGNLRVSVAGAIGALGVARESRERGWFRCGGAGWRLRMNMTRRSHLLGEEGEEKG
jgi:hypothetical protein